MSEPSNGQTLNQLILFVEGFPASHTPLLADEAELATGATSGRKSSVACAELAPDGSWVRTSQGFSQMTLDGSLEVFSGTWPRSGIALNGTVYQRQPLVPLTDEIVSGSWPTPTVSDVKGTTEFHPRKEANFETKHAVTLAQYVQWRERRWPTPTARDWKDGCSVENVPVNALLGRAVEPTKTNGCLDPAFVEYLMGFPLGWTVCEDWETRSSRRSRNSSRRA